MTATSHTRLTGIEEIRMQGIVKRFPGVIANKGIDFDVKAGEIHALLGENGAGKSTLMKQLYGLYAPDAGTIWVDGVERRFTSPRDAIAAGIGMIHQHLMLLPRLSVVENVALGLRSSRGAILDLERVAKRLKELGGTYGLRVDPTAYVWQLSAGEQQRVEILKAIYRGAACLIMDEPTSLLTPQDVSEIFDILRAMANEGHAIIFISHKLKEVLTISDRITVLRDGRVVGSSATAEVTKEGLAQMMVGRPVILEYDRPSACSGSVVVRMEGLWVAGDRGGDAVRDLSLEVRGGEIVGLAGVSGNGQRELAEAIAGLRPLRAGRVLFGEEEITHASPSERIKAGLAYISENRMTNDVIADFSVADNLILGSHERTPYARLGFLDFGVVGAESTRLVDEYEVRTPSIHAPLKTLSGGNIQKLVLARELSRNPKALVACQPTRGLDIGATEYIHSRILALRAGCVEGKHDPRGPGNSETHGLEMTIGKHDSAAERTAILLISEDLDEILALSDRIAVIYEGKLVGVLDRDQATTEKLGLMMAGATTTRDKVPA